MNTHHHRISEFAYQLWESEGRPEGQEQRHWEVACRFADQVGGIKEQYSITPPTTTIPPLEAINSHHTAPAEPAKSLIDTGPITAPMETPVAASMATTQSPEAKKPARAKKTKVSETI